ncbi:hypothetical protein V1512DRAFT_159840, partial [Lipomyces arxii]|uniref:uncharacterized protein n=1 Tax=Lipomyces arxii TaxID=56418 RepID=UPI0034CD0BCF
MKPISGTSIVNQQHFNSALTFKSLRPSLSFLIFLVARLVKPVAGSTELFGSSSLISRAIWPFNEAGERHEHHFVEYAIILILVSMSGVTSGLTLGLMALDETQLYVLSRSGTLKQRQYAQKIIPIRSNGHLLLTTLLVASVITNETLPIVTEHVIGSGAQAVIISTLLIVVFSEIIPQAVCAKHSLAIGAFMAWPVRILIWIFFCVCWPISKTLDAILGAHHGTIYRAAELKELIQYHSKDYRHGGDLKREAVKVMRGALEMQNKDVRSAMTRIHDVFMLDINAI